MPFILRHLRVNDFDFVMLILSHTDKEIKIILLEYISIYNATILSTFCHLTLLNYFEFSLCFFFLFTLYSQTLRDMTKLNKDASEKFSRLFLHMRLI